MDAWLHQLAADLERHEGFRPYAYPDPLSELEEKYPAVKWGWGYKPADAILRAIGEPASKGTPWTVGYGFTHGVSPTTKMDREQARDELMPEIMEHLHVLDNLLPNWKGYPTVVKTVLGNLAFNLGGRLRQFKNTLKYFENREWAKAAANLQRSLWYRQVGSRGEELVLRLKTLEIQPKHKVEHERHTQPDFSNVVGKVTSTEELL